MAYRRWTFCLAIFISSALAQGVDENSTFPPLRSLQGSGGAPLSPSQPIPENIPSITEYGHWFGCEHLEAKAKGREFMECTVSKFMNRKLTDPFGGWQLLYSGTLDIPKSMSSFPTNHDVKLVRGFDNRGKFKTSRMSAVNVLRVLEIKPLQTNLRDIVIHKVSKGTLAYSFHLSSLNGLDQPNNEVNVKAFPFLLPPRKSKRLRLYTQLFSSDLSFISTTEMMFRLSGATDQNKIPDTYGYSISVFYFVPSAISQ